MSQRWQPTTDEIGSSGMLTTDQEKKGEGNPDIKRYPPVQIICGGLQSGDKNKKTEHEEESKMQSGRFRTWFRAAAAALALTTTLMVFPMTGVAAEIQTVGDSTAVSADKAEQIGSMASASYAENGEAASLIRMEEPDQRTANTKVYRCEDGATMAAIYDDAVHYEENGIWYEIDNTLLSETRDGRVYYTNKANGFAVHLPGEWSKTAPVIVEKDGQTLSWTMRQNGAALMASIVPKAEETTVRRLSSASTDGAMTDAAISAKNEQTMTLQNKTAVLMYTAGDAENGLNTVGVDTSAAVQYIVSGSRIKESILLEAVPQQTAWTFDLQTTLTARLQDDRSVLLCDGDEPVLLIEAPYMFDNAGEYSQAVEVELTQTATGLRYTVTPDTAWLRDESRVYPVTIDPTVQTDLSADQIKATEAYSRYPTQNYGTAHLMYAGTMYPNDVRQEYRAFVQLPMPTTPAGVRRRVVAAKLILTNYAEYNTRAKPAQVDVHQITSSWGENTLTWNNMPSYSSTVSDYLLGYAGAGTCTFDITTLADGWVNGTIPNYGVVLIGHDPKPIVTTNGNNMCWYSDNISGSLLGYRPKAWISYRDQSGLEDYWTATSMSVGRSATLAVNHATGGAVAVIPDASVDGTLFPVSVSHIYNASATNDTTYGGKWRLNYDMRIEATPNTRHPDTTLTGGYVYTDGDGTDHYFYKDSSTGRYVDEDGLGLTMVIDSSSNDRYLVFDKSKTKMTFNTSGRLIRITDSVGNTNEITRDSSGRITTIADGAGWEYKFTYVSGRLQSLMDPGSRVTTYGYDSAGQLTTVTYADGLKTTVNYTNGQLSYLASDADALDVEYDDATPPRVFTVLHKSAAGGNDQELMTFTYRYRATTVRDRTGNESTYQFNQYLQTVCAVMRGDGQADGMAQSWRYGASGKNSTTNTRNRVQLASAAQRSTVNQAPIGRLDRNVFADTSTGYGMIASAGQTVSATWDSTKGHTGLGSIKVSRTAITASSAYLYAQRLFSISTAGCYTASAYASTNGATLGWCGAKLILEIWRDGKYVRSVGSGTSYTDQDEWQRLSATVECQAGDTVKLLMGTYDTFCGEMWFDDIQFEKNTEAVNTFNLLENTDCAMTDNGWEKNGAWYFALNSDTDKPSSAARVALITGHSYEDSTLSQTVAVKNGKKGDAYSMGAWAKGTAMSSSADDMSNSKSPFFGLRLEFYQGSTKKGEQLLPFNRAYSGWQFISGEAVAPADYTSVRYSLCYVRSENEMRFALPYLYKDDYGQSYTYDKNGNVVSAADQSKTTTTSAYRSDLLNRLSSPTGSEQMMTYLADGTRRLHTVQTTDGLRTEYTYDEDNGDGNDHYRGNVTKAVVGKETFAGSIKSGQLYYIRNAYSGNGLDSAGSAAGSKFHNYQFQFKQKNQQFYLEQASGSTDLYTLRRADTSMYATVVGSELKLAADKTSIAAKFRVSKNTNGTFTLKTAASIYVQCIEGQPNGSTSVENSTPISTADCVTDRLSQQWYLIEVKEDLTSSGPYLQSEASYTPTGNQLQTVTDVNGGVTQYSIQENTGYVRSVTAPGGARTAYTPDTYSLHTTAMHLYNANNSVLATVGYTYTGDRLQTIAAPGTTYTFGYDALGRNNKISIGSRTLANYGYNRAAGLLTTMVYGNGSRVYYQYDGLGRQKLKMLDNDGSQTLQTTYNDRGQVGLIRDSIADTHTRYTYDLSGRVVGIQRLRGKATAPGAQLGSVEYVYEDGTARLKSQKTVTPFGSDTLTLTYGSSANGTSPDRVAYINGSHFGQINYLYDDLGRLAYRNLWDAHLFTHYTYEDIGTSGRTTTRISSVTSGGTTLNYTYDADGRIKTVKNGDTLVESYTYDTFGRLSTAFGPSVMSAYSYDTNGNLTQKNEKGVTTTYTYGDPAWGDLLTNYNGTSISYDTIGNPLNWRDGMAMTWRHGRELATVTKDGKTFAYNYGADGVRTQKTVDGVTTEYYTVGGKLLAEKTGDRVLAFYYDDKGAPVSVELNGTRYYYHQNLQDDVVGLYSSTGAQVVSYTYDPWGKLLSVTDTSGTNIGALNPLRYRGYYYDTETGFYFLQSRYYDPTVGRFINADKGFDTRSIAGYNLFAYCLNDPVSFVDHSGESVIAAIGLGLLIFGLTFIPASRAKKPTLTPNNVDFADNDVPFRGKPGSRAVSPDGTKERVYGPNGLPQKDRHYTDHGNPKHHPDVPHDHDWGYDKEGKWQPGDPYPSPPGPLEPVIPFVIEGSSAYSLHSSPHTGDDSLIAKIKDFLIYIFQ